MRDLSRWYGFDGDDAIEDGMEKDGGWIDGDELLVVVEGRREKQVQASKLASWGLWAVAAKVGGCSLQLRAL